ncbi:MAG: ABC transporter permease [Bryobacteraceae bacterium]
MPQLPQDLRQGTRSLLRTPGFTAVAVLALALGIGANTAIFTVVNAVLLSPLAYRGPDRLVTILHDGANPVSPANYLDWRAQSRSFETMAAAEYWSPDITGGDQPEHVNGLRLTRNLIPMLGIQPLIGRLFLPDETQDHEVVLSYSLWQRRYSRDPRILGQSIVLNGAAYTVVGVMPPQFKFAPFWATHSELWAPAAFRDRMNDRDGNSLRVFARLKPDSTMSQARADLSAITARLEHQYPGTNRSVVVTPLKQNVVGRIEAPLLVLMGAVGFVLLIACANVAHMLLARIAARQREIAVRTALGASRARIIAQFLTESLLLAGASALAGLLLAVWGTKGLVAISPAGIPRLETVSVDSRVVLFVLGLTVLAVIAFGLAPALQAAAGNLSNTLKEGGRATTGGQRRARTRGVLVASEFALAFILLTGAGLMIRSFAALQSVDPGFDPHHVLTLVVSVAGSKEAAPGPREVFYRQLLDRVRSLPGVQSAGAINHLPLAGDMWGLSFAIEGRPKPRPGEAPQAIYRVVTPGYFETMRLPLIRGRFIGAADDFRESGVIVVNERAAAAYWPGEDCIGKRVDFNSATDHRNWLTIVGVVKNAKQGDWAADPSPEVYLPAFQDGDFLGLNGSRTAYITLVVRTPGDPGALAAAVRQTVWEFDRNLPVSEVATMDSVVAGTNVLPRFEMLLLAIFAGIALLLAAVGIYGVMSYSVSRRTNEIGIRISLGATRAGVLRLVLRQGLVQAAAGMAVGITGSLLLSRLMARMLYGVGPNDPVTLCAVAAILGIAALLATLLPAARATRIEPMAALRDE